MKRITLKQLTEMFQKLPDQILEKKIGYLDLSDVTEDDLLELKDRLIKQKGSYIELCCY